MKGNKLKEFLFFIDTPGIKKYIFESSSLKDIRGASAILDGLNRGWLLDKKKTPEKIYQDMLQRIPDLSMSDFIFANGGSALMIVKGEEPAIQALGCSIEKNYREYTKDAVIPVMAWTEYSPGSFQECLTKVHWKIRRNRTQRDIACSPSTPWARYDDDTRNHRAECCYRPPGEEQIQWISQVSTTRKKAAREDRRVWEEFEDFLGYSMKSPESLESIPGDSTEEKDIAVVYADGNAMGKHIKTISSPKEYAEFSQKIDSATRKATFSALKEIFSNETKACFDIILLGGDDILVVLPPHKACDFVLKTSREFSSLTQGKFSLSFGISCAKFHSPFYQMVEQAENCLKNAKSDKSPGVDFHVNRSGFYPDIASYRNQTMQKDEVRLTCRPFSMSEFQKYWETAQNLKNANVPFSRLHAISCELSKGKIQGHIGWIQGVGRARKQEEKKSLIDLLACWEAQNTSSLDAVVPWKSFDKKLICGFHDILELYEFIK